MQDNSRNQYSERQGQPMYQPEKNFVMRESNNSFKRTRAQYEFQTNQSKQIPLDNQMYSNSLKSGMVNSFNRPKELDYESNQSNKATDRMNKGNLYNQSNQETIYNVGKYSETPLTSKVVNQAFKAPIEPQSFKVMSNQNTQTNNNQQSNFNRPINPPIKIMQKSVMNNGNVNQNQNQFVSEFALIDSNDMNRNHYFISSVNPNIHWKKEYNKYGIIIGVVCAGGLIAYLVSDEIKQNDFQFAEKMNELLPSTASMVSIGTAIAFITIGVVIYVVLKSKDKNETELMAQEDYEELKSLILLNTTKDTSFIGVFLEFFIQTRAEYWNISKLKYEAKVLPLIRAKIQQEQIIQECEVIVSNQALRLWNFTPQSE